MLHIRVRKVGNALFCGWSYDQTTWYEERLPTPLDVSSWTVYLPPILPPTTKE